MCGYEYAWAASQTLANLLQASLTGVIIVSMDAQLQNFWVESINKEASLRFAWQLKYSKEFARGTVKKTESPKKSGHVFNSSVSDKIKKLENDQKSKTLLPIRSPKSRGKTPDRLNKCDGGMLMRDMRPASTNTHRMLYNGISAHEEGRYAYLKRRKEKAPEEKYEFPILSSCQYGWKIMQYANPKPSAYARTCVVKDTFYRSSGIILA